MKTSSIKFPQIKEFLQSTTRPELQFTQGSDRFVVLGTLISFFILFIETLFLILVYRTLPSVLPLLYSLSWGEDQLVQKQFLFMVPVLNFTILVLNMFLSKKINRETSKIIIKLLIINNLAASLFLGITLFKIITS